MTTRLAGALSAVVLAGLPSGPVSAFHDGGVASCAGCHTMHGSEDGLPVDPDDPFGAPFLLRHATSTDVCLACHATENGAVLGVDPTAPPLERGAGNFTFLYEDNLNDGIGGGLSPIDGSHAGHNVASASWGIPVDPRHATAPGGTYASADLTCTSCHDPHGNPRFRMLRDAGSTDASGFAFTAGAPDAIGIDLYADRESPTNHTAYRRGVSDWCGNCHASVHREGGGGFEHPVSALLGSAVRDAYNAYAGPTDPGGGDAATAYIPEVALEDPGATVSGTTGASSTSRLTCLTCHRAHASSGPAATRWDPNVRFLADDGAASGSYPIPSPYPHPDQRALCVKCHYSEGADHGFGRACMWCHRNSGARAPGEVPSPR